MRYVGINDVTTGMQLGSDVYDAFGRILLDNGTVLTKEYIDRLSELGFDGVYVEDELSKNIEIKPMISPMLRGRGINCVRNQDIDGCILVANEIVSEIADKEAITLDMLDLREGDDITYAHSVNVALFSCVIGMDLGFKESELQELALAGLVHDFGKFTIPGEILNKEGRLTQEEYQIMKSHAKVSYDIIKSRWDVTTNVKVAVLFHHENVNGSGYPQGITGDEMTIYTKILHVADVFDALVTKRPYKKGYTVQDAVEFMTGASGIMFDSECVAALLKYVPIYPKGCQMVLSSGEKCIVVNNEGAHALRPIVRLMDGREMDLSANYHMGVTLSQPKTELAHFSETEAERNEMVKPFHRYKIMVVDDMMTNLQLMRGILECLYDVTLVKSGNQALAFLNKNEAPDLILMDIDMPGMDGLETTKKIIEKIGNETPILFVTAINDKATLQRCKDLGAAGYIIRPYKPAFIKSELKRILTGRGDAE